MKKRGLFFFLIFGVSYNLHAVYVSANISSNGGKKIVIFGEDPFFFTCNDNQDRIRVEMVQNESIKRELKYVASGEKESVAVLLESSDYLIEKGRAALDIIEDLDKEGQPLIGINIMLPFFARACEDHYGNLDFMHIDGREKPIILAEETIKIMQTVLKSLKHKKIRLGSDGLLTNEKKKKKVLKNKRWRTMIKKKIFSLCPSITVGEYFDKISSLIKNNAVNDYMDAQLSYYCELAFNHLKKYVDNNPNHEMKKIFWRMFKKETIYDFNKHLNLWFNPLFHVSQVCKLRDSVKASLSTYNCVVVMCDQSLAVALNNYFSKNGYIQEYSVGHKDIIDEKDAGYFACTPTDIRRVLNSINAHVGSCFELQYCKNCFKPETRSRRHGVCTRCKEAWYCSKKCQKDNWQNHKTVCSSNNIP